MTDCGAPTTDREDRWGDVLVEVLDALDRGEAPDVPAWQARYPDFAPELARFLDGQARVDRYAGPLRVLADAVTAATPLGSTLGDFRIAREVGRGGMGVVYEAEQVSLGRRVALKVLPFVSTLDPRQLQRFHNEARTAASLHHEHIVPVHAVGSHGGVHFYAMQFIDGVTLAQVIAARKAQSGGRQPPEQRLAPATDAPRSLASADTAPAAPLTAEFSGPSTRAFFRRAAALIAAAADALDHAHSLGVVHRDVKPGNLMVDGSGKLWVTDFGLARFGPDAGLTMTGDLVGTLRYMSPEQALAKHGLVDHRTDVYALGATLYELLTLRPAVDGRDKEEILKRLAFDEPPAPRTLDKAIPAELETITLKALAKDPAERYASAGELSNDLRRFLADQPVQARRPTRFRRASKWVARHRAAVALTAVAAVLAAAGLLAGLLWHNDRLRAEAENTARERDAAREEQRWAAQAVDDMYTRVAEEWLGPQPRLQPLQREFLEKALEYYQGAAVRWVDAPDIRQRVPELILRVGTIHAALGRQGPAEDALRKALAGFADLAAANPGDAGVRSHELTAAKRLARLYQATGRPADAIAADRRALDLATRLAADFPDRADFRSLPASARADLAFALSGASRADEAEAAYREALAELARLSADERGRARVRRVAANTRRNLGKLFYEAGRATDAESEFRQAAAEFEMLSRDAPGDRDDRWNWAMCLSNLGSALDDLKHYADARAVLERAAALMEPLAADFPDLPDALADLAAVQVNLGVTLKSLRETGGAEVCYRKAIASFAALAVRFRDVPDHRKRLGATQQNLSDLLKSAGRPADAEAVGREAVATFETLAGEFPGTAEYRDDLADALFSLGVVLLSADKFGPAGDVLARALGLREALLAGQRDNPAHRAATARACSGLALALVGSPGPPDMAAGRAVQLSRRAVELDSQHPTHWRTLGLTELRAGNWRESLAALARVQAPVPEHGADYLVRAMARWHLGEKEEARRQFDAAARWLAQQPRPDAKTVRLRDEAAALLEIPLGKKEN